MSQHTKRKYRSSKTKKLQGMQLVLIDHEPEDPRVDTRALASSLDIRHRSVRQLIQKHQADFEEFGFLPFEMAKTEGRGRPEAYFLLNEDQSVFLITMLRVTKDRRDLVKEAKKKLTRLFSSYRKRLQEQARRDAAKAKREWLEEREGGKFERRHFTDAAQEFVEMAKGQGSRNSAHYYRHLTETPYRGLGFEPPYKGIRDRLTAEQLREVRMIESIGASMIRQVVRAQLHYKQQGFPALRKGFHEVAPQVKALIETPLIAN